MGGRDVWRGPNEALMRLDPVRNLDLNLNPTFKPSPTLDRGGNEALKVRI